MSNSKNTMRAIHPGEHLREDYLQPLGMTASALALALRVPAPRINDIIREKRGITPDTALRLAKYFNTTPEYWLRWQTAYDLKIALQKDTGTLAQIFPCEQLTHSVS